MDIYILIALIAVCAFLPRYLPWVVWAGKPLPPKVENILRMTPAAVIAALVAPAVVFVEKEVSLSLLTHPYFLASVATFALMLFTKRLILSSSLGVAVFVLLKML
ncbi:MULTISPECIES: AzlD domain-containing protein [unclassified Hahella]|uniref:AzlD domain-containing protein n=1 Tax=unclassified Hahella TaxID=2624107 RepID=UPI001C1EC3BC|nr:MULTISPECIES: AzlD domain-containing protein [unclassified Hahella]MBU6952448.1 AzlD domain-containing protein [Hahella sp. HN01]MDG9671664.1 AzlD domain-containing protein [Hahella sp. CR1]WLQ11300.1 AzlD domain-containing protein [Hahella sp. HNIBRBA332]